MHNHYKMKKLFPILFLFCLAALSCTSTKPTINHHAKIEQLQASVDSLNHVLIQNNTTMKKQIATFLTFQDNNAENAMNFYVELFDNSKIISTQRWGKDGPGKEGSIMHATFDLDGNQFMCSDSPPIHDWDFSPAISNYIACENESEIDRLFSKLSENGTVTMPLNNYGFSQKFGWVIDRFGISWQLNLE